MFFAASVMFSEIFNIFPYEIEQKIFNIFSQELINIPNIKNSDLEENGKIYYMNMENAIII